jgi:exonuclease VII large subunit
MRVKDNIDNSSQTQDRLQILRDCAVGIERAESLYKEHSTKKRILCDMEKKVVVNSLAEQCNRLTQKFKTYNSDIVELTSDPKNPNVRVCAWDPFSNKPARVCGGWTPQGCKNFRNNAFQLPKNYQEILDRRAKQRAQEQAQQAKIKRKAFDQANQQTMKAQIADMEEKMSTMQRELNELRKQNNELKERLSGIKEMASV